MRPSNFMRYLLRALLGLLESRLTVASVILSLILLLAGIGLTVYLFVILRSQESDTIRARLDGTCDVKSLEVRAGIVGSVTVMYAMREIFLTRRGLGAAEMGNDVFNAYASVLIESGNWTLLSFSRVDVVFRGALAAWERRWNLTMKQVEGPNLVPAGRERDLYVPVVNSYPAASMIRGLDNYYGEIRQSVVRRGETSKDLAVSLPFVAPNANPLNRSQKAFLIFLPMFDGQGRWIGGFTSTKFETTVVPDRFGAYGYALGIESELLFSDSARPREITTVRQIPFADRTISLTCSTSMEYSAGPPVVMGFGLALSLLFPVLVNALYWNARVRQRRKGESEIWQLKTTLLNNVSHELKTPLNATTGTIDILLSEHLPPDQARLLDIAKKSSEHLAQKIDDLIDFSSLEAGKFVVKPERFPWDRFIEGVKRNHPIGHVEVQDEIPIGTTLCTDERCLNKIADVLLSNALKFTPGGPSQPMIAMYTSLEGDDLVIRVIDNGVGMAAEFLAELGTGVFRQQDVTSTRVFGGLGLGLTLAKRMVKLMGGSMTVASREGQGSTFTVRCPCAPSSPLPPVSSLSPVSPVSPISSISPISALSPVPPGPPSTIVQIGNPDEGNQVESFDSLRTLNQILIVDDNDINQRVLSRMLKDRSVVVASNGQEAIDRIREYGGNIGLVLMDIQMPVMDGYEATKQIRKAGYMVPVVAVTADAPGDDMWKVSGMNEFIQKPLRREALSQLLSKYGLPPI